MCVWLANQRTGGEAQQAEAAMVQTLRRDRSALLRRHSKEGMILLFYPDARALRASDLFPVMLADRHDERELLAALSAGIVITRHRGSSWMPLDGQAESFLPSRGRFFKPHGVQCPEQPGALTQN
jgi:hypothetical protein